MRIAIGFVGLFLLILQACSSGGSSSEKLSSIVSGTAGTYQGAGSRWVATFTTTNFTIEKFPTVSSSTADLTVNGTYVQYSTGFRKLTVTSATGSGAPSAGAEAYGFDVPGFAFFLKPIGSNSEPIVMLKSGSCPSGTGFNANWIIAKFDSGKILTDSDDTFGSAVFSTSTPASSTATINRLTPVTGSAASPASMSVPFDYTTCSNSALTFTSGGDTVDMFFTSNGGALVHSYDGASHDSLIFAAPRHTGAVTQAEMAGTYSVLVFDENSSGDKLFPAKLTIPASGSATAYEITDVATDATSSSGASMSSISAHGHSDGLFTATITLGSDVGRISCAYFVLSSSKTIACNGYGNTSSKKPFFFLARSR